MRGSRVDKSKRQSDRGGKERVVGPQLVGPDTSIMETLHLLRSPANAACLDTAIVEITAGKVTEFDPAAMKIARSISIALPS